MRKSRIFWSIVPVLVALLITVAMPAVAHAAGNYELATAVTLAAQEEGSQAGVGVVLGLLGLILALIALVGVIGAVALGIVGIGFWQSQSGED
ncbi:MAG: hypothetical protein D6706_04730 [Chloroflexi bacterium]|nr:MAG: hypothetical protein D6706_04730 [Chloroflexota bacterium]